MNIRKLFLYSKCFVLDHAAVTPALGEGHF